jgi:hypothetical protein
MGTCRSDAYEQMQRMAITLAILHYCPMVKCRMLSQRCWLMVTTGSSCVRLSHTVRLRQRSRSWQMQVGALVLSTRRPCFR